MKRIRVFCVLLIIAGILSGCTDKEAQQAVTNVEGLIAEINIEDLNREAIDAARQAYSELDDELKEKVSNYQLLEDAETEEIKQLLSDARATLSLNIAGCTALCDAVSRVWKSAIEDKYADFNDALSALFQGEGYSYIGKTIVADDFAKNFKTALDTVKEDHVVLEDNMRVLAALDLDEGVYTRLSELYSEYVVLYNQAVSPSGSYLSYTEDTTDSISNINKAEAALDIVWPY